MVAPFWADHDPRPGGEISYEVYNTSSEILSVVNRFIRQQIDVDFDGTWMLLAKWDSIPEYRSDPDVVGIKIKLHYTSHMLSNVVERTL